MFMNYIERVLPKAEVTNTLIELGFMSNEEEDKKLSDEKYQEKIIDGLVNGIEKYLKSN